MTKGRAPSLNPDRVIVSANSCWNIVNFRSGLLAALRDAGFSPIVLAAPDEWSERIASDGYDFIPVAFSRSGMNPVADASLLWRYRRILKAVNARFYLGFTIKPNIYGSLAAQSLGADCINNVSGLGTTFLDRPLLTGIASSLYRLAFARSKVVFFQNGDDRDLFVRNRLVSADRSRLLPGSGVDLKKFEPELGDGGSAGETGSLRFLFIGRILRDKGICEYVEAARQLKAVRPELRFQILGDLDPANRSAVPASQLNDWVARGIVEHLGYSNDVRPFIRDADAVVLPSYREGLPRSLLEGAAMGKPLVASDVPGCRDVVEEGVNGTLCEVRNAQSLADAMNRIAHMTPAMRLSMGRASRKKVQDRFSEEFVIKAYLDVLQELRARVC